MKNTIIIVVGSLVSMLIIFQVFLLLYAEKPELFGNGAKKATIPVQVDSMKNVAQIVHDSIRTEPPAVQNVQGKKNEPAPVKKVLEPAASNPVAAVDSIDWKSKAKILEAMNADDAAKIIKTMKDGEVKALLVKLKKKTAAKILASLDPNRAAKLLR